MPVVKFFSQDATWRNLRASAMTGVAPRRSEISRKGILLLYDLNGRGSRLGFLFYDVLRHASDNRRRSLRLQAWRLQVTGHQLFPLRFYSQSTAWDKIRGDMCDVHRRLIALVYPHTSSFFRNGFVPDMQLFETEFRTARVATSSWILHKAKCLREVAAQ